jgi:hypothetical protein
MGKEFAHPTTLSNKPENAQTPTKQKAPKRQRNRRRPNANETEGAQTPTKQKAPKRQRNRRRPNASETEGAQTPANKSTPQHSFLSTACRKLNAQKWLYLKIFRIEYCSQFNNITKVVSFWSHFVLISAFFAQNRRCQNHTYPHYSVMNL